MRRNTFPGVNLSLTDLSRGNAITVPDESLHTPIFLLFAEKGDGVPYWSGNQGHLTKYGTETFRRGSDYYNHQTLYASEVMSRQGVWLARLIPEDALVAGAVLEMHVRQAQLPQYQKNSDGTRIIDGSGNWVTRKQVDGITVVTEPGIEITYVVRALDPGDPSESELPEEYDAIANSSINDGGDTVNIYPLVAMKGRYAGAYINRTGFRLFYTKNLTPSQVTDVGALTYRFQPIELGAGLTVPDFITDYQSQTFHDVTFAPVSVDPQTNLDISWAGTLDRQYTTTDGDPLLPYMMHVYSTNVQTVANAIIALSPELDDPDPFMVNILSAVGLDGIEYDHVRIINSGSVIGPDANVYNRAGTNGTMTDAAFAAQFSRFVRGQSYPAIRDVLRYPITHLYDSGFPVATKQALAEAYSWSPLIKIDWTTQDVNQAPNTQDEDLSIGAMLRTLAATNVESAVQGTGAIRGGIYAHCGSLTADRTWKKPVPVGLQRAILRADYDGGTFRRGIPKGSDLTKITAVNRLNWTPETDAQKQAFWDAAINYVQYADRNTIFLPDLRSIYAFDDSVLSSDPFVDAVVYIKLIILREWTRYSGREDEITSLTTEISRNIDQRIFDKFRGALPSKTVITTSLTSDALGYALDFDVDLSGNVPKRRWNVNLRILRQGSTTTVQ